MAKKTNWEPRDGPHTVQIDGDDPGGHKNFVLSSSARHQKNLRGSVDPGCDISYLSGKWNYDCNMG